MNRPMADSVGEVGIARGEPDLVRRRCPPPRRLTPITGDAEFKAKVATEALDRGDRTIQAIAAKHEVGSEPGQRLKRQAQAGLEEVFAGATSRRQKDHEATIHDLHAKIGELTVERDFLSRGLR